jgi:membrane fusion protein, multidrug efflux system
MEFNMPDTTPPSTPPKRYPDTSPRRARNFPWVWTIVVIIIVLLALFIWRHHSKSSATAAPGGGSGRRGGGLGPTMVSTDTAKTGSIGIYVSGLGAVTPLKTASISSRVQGTIVAVKYTEGQLVNAGDPLVEIDPGPNQAALTQAEGQLTRDSAILENAKLDQQRYAEAYASNAIPKQQLDTQVATVEQDAGTVKLDQGLLDNAKVQLAYTHITAPISGRVGLRLIDEGNMVQANSTTPLVVITQLQPITVIFTISEDDLPPILEQLRAGKTLTVDAFDRAQLKKLATGTLETLDNQIDPTTGTVKFRAIFTNADESLFPNQFVNARLLVKTLEGVTLLPNPLIQRNADSAFVYVLNDDQTVSMKTITVGTTDGNVSQVDGIDPGTVVVADNFNKLTDGAKVTVRPPSTGGNGTNSVEASGSTTNSVHMHRHHSGTNGVSGTNTWHHQQSSDDASP